MNVCGGLKLNADCDAIGISFVEHHHQHSTMFTPLGLFRSLRCPHADTSQPCTRNPCPYSHKSASELPIPVSVIPTPITPDPKPSSFARSSPSKGISSNYTQNGGTLAGGSAPRGSLASGAGAVPTKRPQVPSPPRKTSEPPAKVQKGDEVEKRPKAAAPTTNVRYLFNSLILP